MPVPQNRFRYLVPTAISCNGLLKLNMYEKLGPEHTTTTRWEQGGMWIDYKLI